MVLFDVTNFILVDISEHPILQESSSFTLDEQLQEDMMKEFDVWSFWDHLMLDGCAYVILCRFLYMGNKYKSWFFWMDVVICFV